MNSNEKLYELFGILQEKESRLDGDFGLDENDKTLWWQYKQNFDGEEDLGDILSDVKSNISDILHQFGFEVTEEYIESSYTSFQIIPKK